MPRIIKCTCGTCNTCLNRAYKREWYERNRHKYVKNTNAATTAKTEVNAIEYPISVTIYECSDGSWLDTEVKALRHELELFKKG